MSRKAHNKKQKKKPKKQMQNFKQAAIFLRRCKCTTIASTPTGSQSSKSICQPVYNAAMAVS